MHTRGFVDTDFDAPQLVLATLGESEQSRFVIATAVRLARGLPNATVHVVHVLPAAASSDSEGASLLRALARERLTSCGERMSAALDRRVETHLESGPTASTIVALARRIDADFVVIGAADASPLRRAVFGSVASSVLYGSPCSVILARPKEK